MNSGSIHCICGVIFRYKDAFSKVIKENEEVVGRPRVLLTIPFDMITDSDCIKYVKCIVDMFKIVRTMSDSLPTDIGFYTLTCNM